MGMIVFLLSYLFHFFILFISFSLFFPCHLFQEIVSNLFFNILILFQTYFILTFLFKLLVNFFKSFFFFCFSCYGFCFLIFNKIGHIFLAFPCLVFFFLISRTFTFFISSLGWIRVIPLFITSFFLISLSFIVTLFFQTSLYMQPLSLCLL